MSWSGALMDIPRLKYAHKIYWKIYWKTSSILSYNFAAGDNIHFSLVCILINAKDGIDVHDTIHLK